MGEQERKECFNIRFPLKMALNREIREQNGCAENELPNW
jgi:hypothetical protein